MKQEMTAYGTKYNLRCPRCGRDEWSEESFPGPWGQRYHKCLHCGIDVRTNGHTEIVAVPEKPFLTFNEMTYDIIKEELKNPTWTVPQ